ncbi:MAG: hypothetical protein PHC78_10770 [Verrucomicrobiota bacterium]|nr:hypothetical protein [Verrucomicrobiota bacterium]
MKSAYELAMERLKAQTPEHTPLTDAQRTAIAEIDSKCKARIAELEIMRKSAIAEAIQKGQQNEAATIQRELADEIRRLEERRDADKEKVRKSPS